jgi:hypothetical protein
MSCCNDNDKRGWGNEPWGDSPWGSPYDFFLGSLRVNPLLDADAEVAPEVNIGQVRISDFSLELSLHNLGCDQS